MRAALLMGLFCAFAGLALGCAARERDRAEQLQKTRMESALTPYVGRSIADFMLDRGPATNAIDMGGNKRAFQWRITGQTSAICRRWYSRNLCAIVASSKS